MPSVENQKLKQAAIDEIKEKLSRASSAVVIDYIGTTVSEADAMRRKLREADIDYKVYKNTLISRAIDGGAYSGLNDSLSGPTALAISYDDATAPARILNGIFKEYKKMSFKAGVVEGVVYDAAGIQEIAEIPTREELLSRLLGSMKSPLSKFVRTLAAIAEDMEKNGGAGSAPAKPAETADESAEAPAEVAGDAEATEEAAEAPAETTPEPSESPEPAAEAAAETATEADAPAEAPEATEEAGEAEQPEAEAAEESAKEE
jgi:large subunit ribosomal protein L10